MKSIRSQIGIKQKLHGEGEYMGEGEREIHALNDLISLLKVELAALWRA